MLLLIACFLQIASSEKNLSSPACRYIPEDPQWPNLVEWGALNTSVSGHLIATAPLASPCHGVNYDKDRCTFLQDNWALPQTHIVSPSSFIAPLFQNGTCSPFGSSTSPCPLGNLVHYAVNATSSEDVIQGVRFAQKHNIRLVIKSTGHDALGRSTGQGSLGIWTHNMDSVDVINYSSDHYTGPALKMGSGVLTSRALTIAAQSKLQILGSSCPSVAIPGGYTQGGGHGLLSSKVGLSADNALEWEVVLANGTMVIASPDQNESLYWALSGGGPGNYGVVISLTVKAFPDQYIGGANFTISSNPPRRFWESIAIWLDFIPELTKAGATAAYLLTNESLLIQPITLPGASHHQMNNIIAPFVQALNRNNCSYEYSITSFSSFVDHFEYYIGLPYGNYPSNQVEGSRLLPQQASQANRTALVNILRRITADPSFNIFAVALDVSQNNKTSTSSPVANSVLPAWRRTQSHMVIRGNWDYTASLKENQDVEQRLTLQYLPLLEAISPGSGSYVNEGNILQSNWQSTFYGENFQKLSLVKNLYDKDGLFYVSLGVGSEKWTLGEGGRLCKAV